MTVLTVVNAGGHLTQAMCIMSAVKDFHLVTSVDLDFSCEAKSVCVIRSTQFNPLIHLKNVFVAFRIIRKIKPDVVFSTGGPICIPFAVTAKLLGVKFIYLDTLSRVQDLSNTAKFLYKYNLTTEMYCQWPKVADKYDRIAYHGKTFNICDSRDLSL